MALVEKKATYAINGCEVYVEHVYHKKASSDKVLLFIHGFISSTYSFRLLIPLLAKHFHLIAIDLPGFGRSSKTTNFTYSFHHYATLVMQLLKILQIQKVTVIGHSMGGQVALKMALRFPNMVEKLILLSSSGYLKRAKRSFYYASFLPFSAKFLKWWLKKRDFKSAFSHIFYHKTIDPNSLKVYTQPFNEEGFYHSLIHLLRDREGDLTSAQLNMVKQETLILWGAEDEIIPVAIGKRLHRDIPRSYFKEYAKTGHLLPEERAEDVAKEIRAFCL